MARRSPSGQIARRRISRSAAIRYKWVLLAGVGLIGFTCGLIGLEQYDDTRGSDWNALDLLYLDLKMLALGGAPEPPLPASLEVARFLLPAVVLSSAITGFIALFRDRYQQARLPFLRGHVLIAGLGDKGLAFAQAMRADGEAVVAIELNPANPNVAAARDVGATVLLADATDQAVLSMAGVRRARHLIATADDATNAEVTLQAKRLVRGSRQDPPLECLAHVVDPDLCRLLSRHGMESAPEGGMRVDFFNFYEQAARTACRSTLTNDGPVVVVGESPLVEHIVLQIAARHRQSGGIGPRDVTILHPAAGAELATLRTRHPSLEQSVSLTGVEKPLDAPVVAASGVVSGGGATLVYVCAPDDAAGVEVALGLKIAARESGSQIVVCAARSGGLASVLTGQGSPDDNRVDGPSALATITVLTLGPATCTSDLVRNGRSEQLARAVHDDYVLQRRAHGELGDADPAMAPWEDLLPDFKQSNRDQADDMCTKLREVGCDLEPSYTIEPSVFEFTAEEIERLSKLEHERWMRERTKAGWTLGPARDPLRRQSPDLVPWDELTEESREKDREAIRRIPTLANLAGLDVCRMAGF